MITKAPLDEKRPLDLRHVKIASFLFTSKTEKGIPPSGGLFGFGLAWVRGTALEVSDVN